MHLVAKSRCPIRPLLPPRQEAANELIEVVRTSADLVVESRMRGPPSLDKGTPRSIKRMVQNDVIPTPCCRIDPPWSVSGQRRCTIAKTGHLLTLWPDQVPVDVSSLVYAALPWGRDLLETTQRACVLWDVYLDVECPSFRILSTSWFGLYIEAASKNFTSSEVASRISPRS